MRGRRNRWREAIRQLYDGSGRRAVRFRYGLLAFDLITITFVIVSSFFLGSPVVEALDVVFGLILADFMARLFISDRYSGNSCIRSASPTSSLSCPS